jgi:Beta-galactosidase
MRPALTELRLRRAAQPLTGRWRQLPVPPRGAAQLGISFRPLQAAALGLDPDAALQALLAYPFQVIRLSAHWNRLEPSPGDFQPGGLDRQLDAAERAGKQVIMGLGAVKTFGYPEFFVPGHYLGQPLREGSLVRPDERPALLDGAVTFLRRVVERYRRRDCIVAWQVEHEAVDPLGMEHSWRLAEAFARSEVEAVRAADPGRPVMMNGFLATSTPVALQQWWRTRDQGDSLAVAQRLADIVGVDFYPRHALASAGPLSVYLDGSRTPWQRRRRGGPAGDDRRRTGRALGGRHHAAQPGRPGHVQLPARGPDRELQPGHALGGGEKLRAGWIPVLGRGVLAAA